MSENKLLKEKLSNSLKTLNSLIESVASMKSNIQELSKAEGGAAVATNPTQEFVDKVKEVGAKADEAKVVKKETEMPTDTTAAKAEEEAKKVKAEEEAKKAIAEEEAKAAKLPSTEKTELIETKDKAKADEEEKMKKEEDEKAEAAKKAKEDEAKAADVYTDKEMKPEDGKASQEGAGAGKTMKEINKEEKDLEKKEDKKEEELEKEEDKAVSAILDQKLVKGVSAKAGLSEAELSLATEYSYRDLIKMVSSLSLEVASYKDKEKKETMAKAAENRFAELNTLGLAFAGEKAETQKAKIYTMSEAAFDTYKEDLQAMKDAVSNTNEKENKAAFKSAKAAADLAVTTVKVKIAENKDLQSEYAKVLNAKK